MTNSRGCALWLWIIAGCSFNGGGAGSSLSGDPSTTTTGATDTTTAPTSEGSGGSECSPGDTRDCDCSVGSGSQVCGAGFVFDECVCPDETTGGTTSDESTSFPTSDPSTTSSESSTGTDGCEQLDVEPNDESKMATQQVSVTCNDEAVELQGTLAQGDVDWFFYLVNDSMQNGCKKGPFAARHTLQADAPVRACVYPRCTSMSGSKLVCDEDSEMVEDDGLPGCCVEDATSATIAFEYECEESNDASIYIVIDAAEEACVDYTIDFDVD